jgi:MPBQ/MSBQ methyltransferase
MDSNHPECLNLSLIDRSTTGKFFPRGTQRQMNEKMTSEIREHIYEKYTGIFTVEHMERHFQDYVGFELAETQLRQVQDVTGISTGQNLLDIGCGYGSFVIVCRNAGIDAEGIDIADFDIGFARKRLPMVRPQDENQSVFHLGDGQNTGLPAEKFDVVTAWNLLEHVPDFRELIKEAFRLLKPGGTFIGIAPNYLAFRQEAHYHVPWYPLFPRKMAHNYLINRGLDPRFFDDDIHYVTCWGIESALKNVGFWSTIPENYKLDHPESIHSTSLRERVNTIRKFHLLWLLKLYYWFVYWNPFKQSVYFVARKSN